MDFWSSDAVSAASNVIMALIWLVYLQLFYKEHRKKNRPYLIIHHAQSNDPSSLCLFVNMSQEPIHVQCVIANIDGKLGKVNHYVTEYRRITPDDQDVQNKLRQGPIQPGGYLTLGTFEDILLGRRSEDDENPTRRYSSLEDIESLQICVAVKHGPSTFAIGARRQFAIEPLGDRICIHARNIDTEQLVTRRKRREVAYWVENVLEPEHRGEGETPRTRQTDGETAH